MPCEFVPYAKSFYGNYFPNKDWHGDIRNQIPYSRTQECIRKEFDKAWLHHQHSNKHHWQHWILRNDNGNVEILEMPDKYMKEMLADWIGAGIAITGKLEVYDWYHKNKEKISLAECTQKWIEKELEKYK